MSLWVKTATIVGRYSARGCVNRWLYHGLHSLDFPVFYFTRPLWDIVVIGLCAAGAILSGLGAVLGFRRLWRGVRNLA